MQPILSDQAVLRRHGRLGGVPTKVTVSLYTDHLEVTDVNSGVVLYTIPLATLNKVKAAMGGLLLLKTDIDNLGIDFNSVISSVLLGSFITLFRNNTKARNWVVTILQYKNTLPPVSNSHPAETGQSQLQ